MLSGGLKAAGGMGPFFTLTLFDEPGPGYDNVSFFYSRASIDGSKKVTL